MSTPRYSFILAVLLPNVVCAATLSFAHRTTHRQTFHDSPYPSEIFTTESLPSQRSTAPPYTSPQLTYNSTDGRFRVVTNVKPTISVFWDNIVQDLVAVTGPGPTIASGAYAVMHSAIFDAWRAHRFSDTRWWKKDLPWRRVKKAHNRVCSLKRLTMHYAAYFALTRSFPRNRATIRRALRRVESRCANNRRLWRAKRNARHIADAAYWRYNTEVSRLKYFTDYRRSSSIEIWKPERIPIDSKDGPIQVELTPLWGNRYTFGVRNGASIRVPPPKRFLRVDGKFDLTSRTVTFPNGTRVPFSESLVNPEFVEQAERVVDASAESTPLQRFTAEVWEAGASSSFPPGQWLSITQWVSARARHSDDEDAGIFFAVANALSDAGVATWFAKYRYRYARPVRVIRELGELGLLGDVRYYDARKSRVVTVPATQFNTYQQPGGEPSPSFPEYTSGHSAFSSAAAEVLRLWTRSDAFGAGVKLAAFDSRFERGRAPTRPLRLYWETFTDAANEAGMSRIYGGIHFDDANIQGLRLGRRIGTLAFRRAKYLWASRWYHAH